MESKSVCGNIAFLAAGDNPRCRRLHAYVTDLDGQEPKPKGLGLRFFGQLVNVVRCPGGGSATRVLKAGLQPSMGAKSLLAPPDVHQDDAGTASASAIASAVIAMWPWPWLDKSLERGRPERCTAGMHGTWHYQGEWRRRGSVAQGSGAGEWRRRGRKVWKKQLAENCDIHVCLFWADLRPYSTFVSPLSAADMRALLICCFATFAFAEVHKVHFDQTDKVRLPLCNGRK